MTSRRNVLAAILLGAGVAMAPFEESASAFSQQSDDYAYRSRSPPSNAPMENTTRFEFYFCGTFLLLLIISDENES